jgi:hypothetical protein
VLVFEIRMQRTVHRRNVPRRQHYHGVNFSYRLENPLH